MVDGERDRDRLRRASAPRPGRTRRRRPGHRAPRGSGALLLGPERGEQHVGAAQLHLSGLRGAEQPDRRDLVATERTPGGQRVERSRTRRSGSRSSSGSAARPPGARAPPPGHPGTARPCRAPCRPCDGRARSGATPRPAAWRRAARPPRRRRPAATAAGPGSRRRRAPRAPRRARLAHASTSRQAFSAAIGSPMSSSGTPRPAPTRAISPRSPLRRAAASARWENRSASAVLTVGAGVQSVHVVRGGQLRLRDHLAGRGDALVEPEHPEPTLASQPALAPPLVEPAGQGEPVASAAPGRPST